MIQVQVVTTEEQKQIDNEYQELKRSQESAMLQQLESFDQAKQGEGKVVKKIQYELYEDVLAFVELYIELNTVKKTSSLFYVNFHLPMLEKYEGSRFSHPTECISHIMAKCISAALVHQLALTKTAKDIAQAYKAAYNNFQEVQDEELRSVVQLLRSYMLVSTVVKEHSTKTQKQLFIKLIDESRMVDVFDLLETDYYESIQYKPMICQPREHHNLTSGDGGYLVISSPLLKKYDKKAAVNSRTAPELFTALNALQATRYEVNADVLEYVQKATHPAYMRCKADIKDLMKNQAINTKRLTDSIRSETDTLFQTRKKRKENPKPEYLDTIRKLEKSIQDSKEELTELQSSVSKSRCYNTSLKIAEEYKDTPFWHPIFCDQRGRIYTYNTSLSFQGNGLAKALIGTSRQRITEAGLYELKALLGATLNGYSKKTKAIRVKHVDSLMPKIHAFTEHNYEILKEVDSDEIYIATAYMLAISKSIKDPLYKTNVFAYIDSTSSAIQIQALIQHDKKSAFLTNLLPPEGDDLPDAYMEVANECKQLTIEVSKCTDEDLEKILTTFIKGTNRDEPKMTMQQYRDLINDDDELSAEEIDDEAVE